jgi:hypothetical protein
LLRGGSIRTRQHGFFAAYISESRLQETSLTSEAGNGLLFGAISRVHVGGLGISAREGVGNVGFSGAMAAAGHLLRFLAVAGYGQRDEASMRGLLWLLLEASIDWAGLRTWFSAMDGILAQSLPGFRWPTASLLAMSLEQAMRKGKTEIDSTGSGLSVLDLEMQNLDITSQNDAIRLSGIFPLGGLRVQGCTLAADQGRGVEILANAYVAHMELFEQLIFFALSALEKAVGKPASPAVAELYRAIDASLKGWLVSARRRFSSEAVIQGNTIQSQRTGIDTNLFQARIADNHITLPERRGLEQRPAPARIFGRILAVTGAPVVSATVYVPEAASAVQSDAQGHFQVTGLAAGTYRPVISAAGFPSQTLDPLSLAAGESREVHIELRGYAANEWSYGYAPFQAEAYSASSGLYRSIRANLSNRASRGLVESLEESDGFLEMADILREASYLESDKVAAGIVTYANQGAAQRLELAGVLRKMQGQWGDAHIEAASVGFEASLQAANADITAAVRIWVEALLSLVDSRGILVRAPGCAIEDNRVVVRRDERGDTEAVGGIQVSVRYQELLALLILELYLEYLAERQGGNADAKFDTQNLLARLLARIPSTSIHRNELSGGIGHGIALFGSRREPELLRAVAILDNRIDSCAATGIFLNASAHVIDLAVSRNAVTRCGDERGFSQVKGGIVLNGAAAVSVQDNTVTYCALESDVHAYGIDLNGLLGLSLNRNVVLANGGRRAGLADGGVRLSQVSATVQVLGNTIENNRGMGLLWEGAGNGKVLVNASLEKGAQSQLGLKFPAESPRAVFSNNAIAEGKDGLSPALRIGDLESLTMNSNTLRGSEMAMQLVNVRRLSAGHNQMEVDGKLAALFANIQQGVVEGNVSTAPIDLQNAPSVIHVNNVPATV